ncbi:MAG TPA: hypothetical protein VGO62_03435, partial [Myxococcota bacterium]
EGEGEGEGTVVSGGETCDAPVPLAGTSGSFRFDLTGASADLDEDDFGDCTGLGSPGNDQVFSITIPAGQVLTLADAPDDDFDPVLFVINSCDANQCVGSDEGGQGSEEDVAVPNAGPGDLDVIIVLDSFDSDQSGGGTFSYSVGPVQVLDEGAVCDPNGTGGVCNSANSDQCVFDDDVGDFLCKLVLTLAEGDACDPNSSTARCDTAGAGDECVSVSAPDDFHCEVPVTLNQDDACVPNTTAAECDRSAGLACVAVDTSFACENPDAERCVAPIEITDSVFITNLSGADGGNDSCNASGGDDLTLHYVVQADFANVTFQALGVNALEVRSTCADPNSAGQCVNGGDVASVNRVAAGTDIFVLIDGDHVGDDRVVLQVTETALTEVADGDPCDPTSATEFCDATSLCFDDGSGGGAVCSPIGAQGTGLLSFGQTYLAPFECESSDFDFDTPYLAFTLTNTGGSSSSVTAFLTQPGDDGGDCFAEASIISYTDPFNPNSPEQNCQEEGDPDFSGEPNPPFGADCAQLAVTLDAGASIDLVVVGFDSFEDSSVGIGVLAPGTTVTLTPQ